MAWEHSALRRLIYYFKNAVKAPRPTISPQRGEPDPHHLRSLRTNEGERPGRKRCHDTYGYPHLAARNRTVYTLFGEYNTAHSYPHMEDLIHRSEWFPGWDISCLHALDGGWTGLDVSSVAALEKLGNP